jgi:dTDP-L-rhamnose 4-epimerase
VQFDLPSEATLVLGDVTSPDDWQELLDAVRPETVVHLAAETGTGQSLHEASRHAMVNVVGTTRMLDALMRADAVPEHLVLASSRAVYGEGEWASDTGAFYPGQRSHRQLDSGVWDFAAEGGMPARSVPSRADRTVPGPTSVYGATKLAQEHVCSAWVAATGSALSVLRLQNVYGPGQSLHNAYTGILALFGQLASSRQAIDVYEDGRIIRDFVFIEDAVQALSLAVGSPPEGVRTLDVGSGTPTTIHEVACRLAAMRGAAEPVVSGRFRDGDVRAASCEIALTAAKLGYTPQWDLDRGLEALLQWIENRQPTVAQV